MKLSLKEGEAVMLPCRHCASLSLRLVVRKGTTTEQCHKCSGRTSFLIDEGPAGLELQSREAPARRGPDRS